MSGRYDRDWKSREKYEELKAQGMLEAISTYDLKDPFGNRWDKHPNAAKPKKPKQK